MAGKLTYLTVYLRNRLEPVTAKVDQGQLDDYMDMPLLAGDIVVIKVVEDD